MQPLVCFVSDFGLGDTWVGVCHAVVHKACPHARMVDLDHQVPPFDVRKGSVVAASGVWQLPEAIHLVVVDPGVGGERRDLCMVCEGGTRLVGPDNGVLMPAARRAGGVKAAYAVDPERIDFKQPLATFHARDVLAPTAAALACGVEPASLGAPVDPADLAPAPFEPSRIENGTVVAEVLDIDRFGSIRIGIAEEELAGYGLVSDRVTLGIGHLSVEVPLRRTFSDVESGEPVALVDSSGWLTLALNRASAGERYGVEPGGVVRVSPHH
ncbi:MAG: SAM-dependent chlorinase/fluorinase [Coriobacteriia bacterium]|nr:SAM-dependent chlorinase/fluorinase [Coriobacteriia bacterium]